MEIRATRIVLPLLQTERTDNKSAGTYFQTEKRSALSVYSYFQVEKEQSQLI